MTHPQDGAAPRAPGHHNHRRLNRVEHRSAAGPQPGLRRRSQRAPGHAPAPVHPEPEPVHCHLHRLPGRPSADTRGRARRGPCPANIGGRITPAIIADIAYAGYLVDVKAPQGPYFEVAIIHHTDCGSALLADDKLRHSFAEHIGTDERTLADTPVLDPARTVTTDVNRVLWAQDIPDNVQVSGDRDASLIFDNPPS
jgi:hypothetical protein